MLIKVFIIFNIILKELIYLKRVFKNKIVKDSLLASKKKVKAA
jgi:hypothetical protein